MSARAVILLSGGLDSATVLAMAARDGWECYALSFRYGQRHELELRCARRIAAAARVQRHIEVPIDLRVFGGSALTSDMAVPKDRSMGEMAAEIPITYVPARNTIFLAFALAWAEVLGSRDIFIGVNALDYSGYPDCRPEFISAFGALANLATRAGVQGQGRIQIHAPLINLRKSEIIQLGLTMGVNYADTISCYDPAADGKSCGRCDSCKLRRAGFAACRVADPIAYVQTAAETSG
ncbi:MAG: 7-cyano-7-deazaguanine synthase QueC [Phycisphaerae bacterium]|nr:7-cyano-7-deazaguanine synthase QueC [Phycisphaerae bacterium]